jgi:hypothetical protein
MRKRLLPLAGYLILAFGVGFSINATNEAVHNSAVSRVATVRQRCELTSIVLSEAQQPDNVAKLKKSKAGCYKQLHKVEAEAN